MQNNRTKNSIGEVRACDCGGVNLSIGAVTLHVAADEVAGLAELAGAASALAREQATPRPKPPPARTRGSRPSRLLH